jgi:hypothetical protein
MENVHAGSAAAAVVTTTDAEYAERSTVRVGGVEIRVAAS